MPWKRDPITDHGELDGLADDDHTQYLNETRHDAIAHTDGDAIHDDVSGEIAAVTEKGSPVSGDLLLIEDSEDGNTKKRIQVGNLPVGSGSAAGELLMQDGVTDPPVPIENETQDDWLYEG